MTEKTFECEECGKTIKSTDEKTPECCGKPMKKLPMDICVQPAHSEHARPMENEDACDEFRAGE